MLKKGFLLLIFMFICMIAKPRGNDQDTKLFMEGSLRLSFGNKTRIGVGPTVNYPILNNLSVGAGVIAEYYSNVDASGQRFHTGIFGTALVANYRVERVSDWLNQRTAAYLYFEQEFLNVESKYFTDSETQSREWSKGSYLGFKIKRKIGDKDRFALGLIVAWNLHNNDITSTIYSNPQIKLAFQF